MKVSHQQSPARNTGADEHAFAAGLLPDEQEFGQRVRAVRSGAGLSQRQLAERMTAAGYRMHQTTVAKIEAAERPVVVGELLTLCRVLGTAPAALLDAGDGAPAEYAHALASVARFTEALRREHEAEAALDVARKEREDAWTAANEAAVEAAKIRQQRQEETR